MHAAAGVGGRPAGIDDVTCRALFQRPSRHGPALSTAAMFADALASAAPPVPLPLQVSPAATSADPTATRGYGYQPDGSTNSYPPPDAVPHSRPYRGPGPRRPQAARQRSRPLAPSSAS